MNQFGKIFIFFATTLILLSSCSKKEERKGKGAVNTSRIYPTQVVEKSNAMLESVYPVTLKGEDDAEIKPRVNGYIDNVYVNEGDIVKKGQRLFSINSPTSIQDFTTAEAALESAKVLVSTAKIDVDRIRRLAEKEIVSNVQLQSYENAYKVAETNKTKAEAALTAAKAAASWTVVPSPIDGVVGAIPYRTGNAVTNATSLTTVSNTKTIFAYFSVNEKTLVSLLDAVPGNTQSEKIKNIPNTSLILSDGTVYPEEGKISAISGVVNTITGSINLRAEFPNPNGMLKSGASANISIPRQITDVIVIPQKATFSQQNKIIAYKALPTSVNDQDSIIQVVVSVLPLPDGQNYAVTEGLNPGDKIVMDGVATLRNGSLIKTR